MAWSSPKTNFPPSFSPRASIARHLFFTGLTKNILTTVINTSGITFTVHSFKVIVEKVLLKVLPQIQKRKWCQKWNLFISHGGNCRRHFGLFILWAAPSKEMRGLGHIWLLRWNQPHYRQKYPVTVSYPDYGSCRVFDNFSSHPHGLWVNSPWGRGLLTQSPWGWEE